MDLSSWRNWRSSARSNRKSKCGKIWTPWPAPQPPAQPAAHRRHHNHKGDFMFASFSTALSALSADSTAISVVGNNLANLNTTGFKSSTVSFHDLVTESLGAGLGDTQVGFGVGIPITLRQFSQGAIQNTGGTLDAAIQGDGFFIVQSSDKGTQ